MTPHATGTDLGAEAFGEREAARQELWRQGLESDEALRKYAASDDPEIAWRARQILQLLELKLGPDTSPQIIKLVESFLQAKTVSARESAFLTLLELKAYPQLVRLPRQLMAGKMRDNYQRRIDDVIVGESIQLVLEEKDEEALAILAEARESPAGNLRWVALASAMGKREELAPSLDSDDQMRFARWAGDVDRIRSLAPSDHEIQTTLQIIDGNPLPLLEAIAREPGSQSDWARLAIALWEGREDEPEIRKMIERTTSAATKDMTASSDRTVDALHLLARLGFAELALPIFEKIYPDEAFAYYHSLDKIDQALACYGLVAGGETDEKWLRKNLSLIDDEWDLDNDGYRQLINVAFSLYEHGELAKSEVILRAIRDRINEMQNDEDMADYLTYLAGNRGRSLMSPDEQRISSGFPDLAIKLAQEEGGDLFQPAEFLRLTFNARESVFTLYSFLEERYPEVDDWEKVRAVFAAFGLEVSIPRQRVNEYLSAFEEKIQGDDDIGDWEVLAETALYQGDTARLERALVAAAAADPESVRAQSELAVFYFANHDFAKAAEIWLKIRGDSPESLTYGGHGYLAISLIMSGQEEAAAASLALLEKLSLSDGQWLATLSELWTQCGEHEKAYQCERRALLLLPSGSPTWTARVFDYARAAQAAGRWKTAAAASQVSAAGRQVESAGSTGAYLGQRAQLDYCLAMAALEEGREEEGRTRLDRCVELGGNEGFFANEPLWELRKAGRFKEARALWDKIAPVYRRAIELYPNADNTLNTAAWAAARAGVDTEEAMGWVDRALVLRPSVSAYLDTKAEVYFAQGKREEALVWSGKACAKSRSISELGQIRLQQTHFANDDFYLPPMSRDDSGEEEEREVSE